MYKLLEDKSLKSIIKDSNIPTEDINKALRSALYLLQFKPHQHSDITKEEIKQINEYKNKSEFNHLFKLLLNGRDNFKNLFFNFV